MKYLLSNGRATQNIITYIKDIIFLNMTIRKGEIPGFDGGSDELIPDIETDNLEEHVSIIMKDILKRVENSFKNIDISIDDIIINNSRITVKININNLLIIYEIPRSN
jgi:hypothetical protein